MATQPRKTHRVGVIDPDTDAAAVITRLFAAGGDNTSVLLQAGASYNLHSKIFMRGHHQELATEGYPVDNERKAKLYTRGKEALAIDGLERDNIAIRCLYIDGLRREFGPKGAGSLVLVGGWKAKDPVIDHCVLRDPRGWSCCHVMDGSQGARVTNNEVGPAGEPAPNGPWADGLSIACRSGLIANNTITDVTDGGIVVFCAPGTTIVGNTVIARNKNMLGGINMVDAFPFEMNYTGTKVINNHIRSEGAFIHMGIGIGPNTWSDDHEKRNYGGTVMDNIIGPGRFGYGIAAGGCKDFTVLQNIISSDTVFSGSMEIIQEVTPPTPFLRKNSPTTTGTFQPEFVEGPVRFLIGIRDWLGKRMQYHASALRWEAGQKRQPGCHCGMGLLDVRFELLEDGSLVAWDQKTPGRVLWSSQSGRDKRRGDVNPVLTLDRQTARLLITGDASEADSSMTGPLWDPMRYLLDIQYKSRNDDPVLHLSDEAPFMQVQDNGHYLFSTSYVWSGFVLLAGRFVAIPGNRSSQPPAIPHESRPMNISQALADTHIGAPPPVPARPERTENEMTWLYLDQETTQLVLHTSQHPQKPQEDKVLWRSPNWKLRKSVAERPAHANLQGDGNLVIYSSDDGAVWASGTNAEHKRAQYIAFVAAAEDQHSGRVELRSGDGRCVWNSRGNN